jgi:hypothetical protein
MTRRLRLALLGILVALSAAGLPATAAAPAPASGAHRLVVPPAAASMPGTWHQRFVIGYGPGKRLLGTSPGGDSGTLDIGPEYGAPGPDGSWWFLDAAKRRIAHYSSTGHYLGRVRIPRGLLVGGRYFQWQLPHVLADGSLVAARQAASGTYLLRLRGGVLDEIPVSGRAFFPTYDDGRRLYGFAGRALVAVDPRTGAASSVATLKTPSGSPFTVSVGRRLTVTRPGGSASLRLVTASGARAHVGLQLRAGSDGVLHLFLTGLGEDDETVQLVGETAVGRTGSIAPVEPLTNPFSEADPGSPAQLVMAPGSSTPMLVYVLTDGVHVYERTG